MPATVWMEAAISSIEVEVSSAACAWLCAPDVMSLALAEISPAELATWTDASWMLSTILRRLITIWSRLWARAPISSSPARMLRLSVRLPLATAVAISTMC